MNDLTQVLPWLIAMGVLIVLSALFSGSEAALFSLRHRDRRRLHHGGPGGRVAAKLLESPERLLSAILFWNLLINMTYFGIASIVGSRLQADQTAGSSVAVVFTVISLLTIIFLSEMLPKSFAVLAPARLSILLAPPLSVAVRVVNPILPLVRVSNLAASRLIWPTFEPEPEIDLEDIERAIELGTEDAALLKRERDALRGLVEMAEVRVDELMRPRSKLRIWNGPLDRSVLSDTPPPGGYLMLADANSEVITAAIGLRNLRPSQLDDLEEAAEPVIYVPWSAWVSQVLDQLNDEDRSVAVVVNEFGESIGAVSVDDILRDVLAAGGGRDEWDQGEDPIRQLGPDHYRMSGATSLRLLTKHLRVESPEERSATVAGYIQRHNERLPRSGDTATLDRFELAVTDEDEENIWIEVYARRDDVPPEEDVP